MNQHLIKGDLKKSLLLFAIPLFFSQLFQTLYNTADTVIIGYYLGDVSLAAIGAVASLFELIVGFCTGFGSGLGVVAAQKYGAKDLHGFRKTVALSMGLSTAIALIISFLMVIGLRPILKLLKTPADIFEQSYAYISVISGGLIITIFYNLFAGLLRASGDSKTPTVVLLISSIINVFLDVVFITQFKMGIEGTAWATLIAQAISLAFCIIWILWKKKNFMPKKNEFQWDSGLVKSLTEMGLSLALMSSIVSIGTLILQAGINVLGTLIITGHTAARKIISMVNLPLTSLSLALSSFVAQNVGAGQLERCSKGIAFSNRIGIFYSIVLTIITWLFAPLMISAISGSGADVVVETGSLYLKTNIPFFPMLCVLLNLRQSLQAMSLKLVPILSSVIELAGKMVFTWLVLPFTGYLGVCATEPFVWSCMAIFLAVNYLSNTLFKKHHLKPSLI